MLKLVDLARRGDFDAGPLRISPSRRVVQGPSGSANLEPIVMKVFLLLLDAGGGVVTRDELFADAWGGVFVADDSLNRAIARVRKVASETAPGLFEVETIPRTGYRLTGSILESIPASKTSDEAANVTRRRLIGAAAVGTVMIAAGGVAWLRTRQSKEDARFDALLQKAREVLVATGEFGNAATIRDLHEALRIHPDSAEAWGLLALMHSFHVQNGEPSSVQSAEDAAQRAFAVNPREPNAMLAMFELQGSTLDWFSRDQKLRQILGIDPKNVIAMTELVALLQAAGLNRESWNWNERALSIQPLSPDLLGRRALKLWIAGRTNDADKVVDQVRDLWPQNHWGYWVRFLILALSGRAPAAQAMLVHDPRMIGAPPMQQLWREALPALAAPTAAALASARKTCRAAATQAGSLAGTAVMILSALGLVDDAFEIANGFLLWRGRYVRTGTSELKQLGPDASWRIGIQWLFTPACAPMRADKRFLSLCDGVGLTEYWRRRGLTPDYQHS